MHDELAVTQLKVIRDRLANGSPEDRALAERIKRAQLVPQNKGGIRGWFNDHDQTPVGTHQFTFDRANNAELVKVWEPGVRTARWNPNGVRFFSGLKLVSERPFYGTKTIASTDDTFIGYHHDSRQVMVYTAVNDGK